MIIYGGSFNPPTKAHVEVVNILKQYRNEYGKVIIYPTKNHAFDKDLVDINIRMELLNKLFPKNAVLPMGTYMYDHLKVYTRKHYIAIGSDLLKDLPKWKDYDKLINEYTFLVIIRDNDISNLSNIKHYKIIGEVGNNISSSGFKETKNYDFIPSVIKTDVKNIYT